MSTRAELNKEIQDEIIKEEYQKKLKKISKFLIITLTIIFSMIGFGITIGAKYTLINEIKITDSSIPNSFNGIKIVHFSDILYNSLTEDDLNKLQTKINNLKPDILIFTGDIKRSNYDLSKNDIKILNNFFLNIKSSIKKYAVYGDNDTDILKVILENTDFTILDNSTEFIYYKENNPVRITGYNTNKFDKPEITTPNYSICILHNPDFVDSLDSCNLTLAGDTLGGEIGLLKNILDNHKYNNNYYEINNNKVYISNGIGNNISMRLFNQPSINLYRLTTK